MKLTDLLELLVSLLTLGAVLLVAVEKIAPTKETARKTALESFLKNSFAANPWVIQRMVAMSVARMMKRGRLVTSVGGWLGAPLVRLASLTKNQRLRRLAGLLVASVFGVLIVFCIRADGSVVWLWLASILASIVLGIFSYPGMYALLNSKALFGAVSAGNGFNQGGQLYAQVPSDIHRPRLERLVWLHPRLKRRSGTLYVKIAIDDRVFAPLALAVFALAPISVTLIDGFYGSPFAAQVFMTAVGALFVVMPILFIVMVPTMLFQHRFAALTPRQTVAAGRRNLSVMGPSAVIAALAAFVIAWSSQRFTGGGGGWFVSVIVAADTVAGLLTGAMLREVVKRRGSFAAGLRVLVWIVLLLLVVSALKLHAAMLLSPQAPTFVQSAAIAWGASLFDGQSTIEDALFLASQTTMIYWLIYFILLLFLLTLGPFAWLVKRTLGLAVVTATPFEILATYIAFVAGLLTVANSFIKIGWPA